MSNEYFLVADRLNASDLLLHACDEVLVHRRTPFQELVIARGAAWGKALILDGKWQSCSADEFLYHEPLVHPACLLHGGPRRVLILGGGEGATAREVLRWRSVEEVVMIDLDREVVEACRTHLDEFHQGAFTDPRCEVQIRDARDFLAEDSGPWDVIVSDLTDPIEEGPAYQLFTREYFAECARILYPEGVLVVQSGSIAPGDAVLFARLHRTLEAVFPAVRGLTSYVPSFAAPWSFLLAARRPLTVPEPATADHLLESHGVTGLRMFDGITLQGLTALPKHLRDLVATEQRIYTMDDPPRLARGGP
ncbi:MAG: polyamine aminopropyltransferase [Acidobacteriota bacterium]